MSPDTSLSESWRRARGRRLSRQAVEQGEPCAALEREDSFRGDSESPIQELRLHLFGK